MLAVNAKAVLVRCQAVLAIMLAARRGIIVNVASLADTIATPTSIPYGASKPAVISSTRSLAAAFAKDGVRVNCVCPGLVDTDMWKQIDHDVGVALLGKQAGEVLAGRVSTIPLRRPGAARGRRACGWISRIKQGRYMTGQAINVTGGMITH